MCFGGSQPSAPEVRYVGPSEEDIQRNEQALAQYQQDIAAQQQQFQTTLQQQIDQANQDKDELGDACDQVRQLRGAGSRCAAVSPAGGGLMLVAAALIGLLSRRREDA